MGQLDRAGFDAASLDDFHAAAALAEAEDCATICEDFDAADEELFEDDLISLIASRPSRQQRRPSDAGYRKIPGVFICAV